MPILKNLNQLFELAKDKGLSQVAVVAAHDEAVIQALKLASEKKIIYPILIGDQAKIEKIASGIGFKIKLFEIINESNTVESARLAVKLVRDGKANMMMKGLISTVTYLKAIIHKEKGITNSKLLSHFAISEIPEYHKLLAFTDAAMNIAPTLEEKLLILNNALHVMYRLGYEKPKVALMSSMEHLNLKIESSVHAIKIKEIFQKEKNKLCLIDGPFALDNAISKRAADHKDIPGDVAGNADLLLLPNLDSGNILYKAINFLAKGTTAAIITGAKVPIILTSRADNEQTKFMSILLAAAVS